MVVFTVLEVPFVIVEPLTTVRVPVWLVTDDPIVMPPAEVVLPLVTEFVTLVVALIVELIVVPSVN